MPTGSGSHEYEERDSVRIIDEKAKMRSLIMGFWLFVKEGLFGKSPSSVSGIGHSPASHRPVHISVVSFLNPSILLLGTKVSCCLSFATLVYSQDLKKEF